MPKYSDGFQKASLVSSLLTAVAPCQVCAVQKPAFPQYISSSVADPFGDLDVQHEEVHMLLSFIQRQRLANDCNQHGSAGYTHDSSEETNRLATAGSGRYIPVAHCEEGDGYEPHSCVHVTCCCLGLSFTQSEHPGSSDPEEADEDQQRACRVFVHQYLEYKAEGEVDVVEGADAPVGGAQQDFAVQQDGSVHPVQAEEHQH